MIYTLTFNPSLDYIVTIKEFALGKTNRTVTEQMLPGGKGINVSMVLHNLGIESTVLGFTAGFVGEEIERRVRDMGLSSEFIRVDEGVSRINIKMKDFDGTEINGQGPVIGAEDVAKLLYRLDELREGDVLVMAGSVPKSMPASIYRDIMDRLAGRGILFVVDASGELLTNVLEYKPFLIKPNLHELEEIFQVELSAAVQRREKQSAAVQRSEAQGAAVQKAGEKVEAQKIPEGITRDAVIPYARMLQEKGARNVLVSMAGEGAVLVAEDGSVYQMAAPTGKLVNAVGAGDSMVAGFLAGWKQGDAIEEGGTKKSSAEKRPTKKRYLQAFKLSVAAGSASAFSEQLATKEEILELYRRL